MYYLAFFTKKMVLYKNVLLKVTKNRVTSGASRKKTKASFSLLLNKRLKCLSSRTSWKSGISRFGKRTVLSKGRRLLNSKNLLYSRKHLDNSIHFHHSHFFNLSTSNIYALVFSSSGKVSYIRNLTTKFSFQLLRTRVIQSVFMDNYNTFTNTNLIRFNVVSSIILFIKFMTKVINLQPSSGENIKYSKSSGSYSIVLKKNRQLAASIIKLPSGVKKIFSSFSSCNLLKEQPSFKTFIFNSSSKELVIRGSSPRSRGVAKNPVDHPHGGRTKSLKYPRTP